VHLKELDLNLIAIFEAVYEERNQSKAAERLGISQPAISHALTRLRTTLNDQLFQDRGMHPTALAHDLYSQFHLGLNHIRAGFNEVGQFSPASSHRHFSIAASYSGGVIYGPELFKAVRAEAPDIRLTLRTIDPSHLIPDLLRQKSIDVAICHGQHHDGSLCYERLADRRLVIIGRRGHPRLCKGMPLEDIWSLDFAAVHGEEPYYGSGEHELPRQIRQERVVLEMPTAMLLMSTLTSTDLVSLTTLNVAEFATRHFPLEIYDLPDDVLPVQAYMVWHKNMEWDPANQWLRGHIRTLWSTP
jgi:DNA-binding transcriptional LysR family regulator